MIDKAVKMMVDSKSANGDEEGRAKYHTRVQEHKTWLAQRGLVNARPG